MTLALAVTILLAAFALDYRLRHQRRKPKQRFTPLYRNWLQSGVDRAYYE